MVTERQTKATGYVHLTLVCGAEGSVQIQRHKNTVMMCCLDLQIKLAHKIVDIGGRQGRGWTPDLLVVERAAVLVVPSLAQLARKTAELAAGEEGGRDRRREALSPDPQRKKPWDAAGCLLPRRDAVVATIGQRTRFSSPGRFVL